MRKSKQEITSRQVLDEVLSGAEICRIAMMDGDRPYILPFNYGHRDGCIYIHAAPEGKKIDLIRNNNLVCFEIEHQVSIFKEGNACKWTTRYRSVVGYGHVDIITDDSGKQQGLEVIMAQHGAPELNIFEPKNMKNMVILKLTITSLTGKQSSNWNKTK